MAGCFRTDPQLPFPPLPYFIYYIIKRLKIQLAVHHTYHAKTSITTRNFYTLYSYLLSWLIIPLVSLILLLLNYKPSNCFLAHLNMMIMLLELALQIK